MCMHMGGACVCVCLWERLGCHAASLTRERGLLSALLFLKSIGLKITWLLGWILQHSPGNAPLSVRGFQACSVPPSTCWREVSCYGKLPVSFVYFMSILDAEASLFFPGVWEAAFLQQFRASRDSVPSLETVSTKQKCHCILRELHKNFSLDASEQDL